jgi:hypothetical protein
MVTLTVTHTLLRKSTVVPIATPTLVPPVPTQLPEQTIRMDELLHSKDCKLPCYLGILPGKTTLEEGKAILENIGAEYHGSYTRETDHATDYFYEIWIWHDVPPEIFKAPAHTGDYHFFNAWISLISTNDIVQIIEAGASAPKSKDEYRAYWSMYFANQILQIYGPPDQMYLDHIDPEYANFGRALLLVYGKLGAVIQIEGNEEDNNICTEPGYEARNLSLRLSLYDPNSGVNIYADGRVPPTDHAVWIPIEEALGVTNIEFYRQVVSNPSICFTPIIIKP